VDVVEERDSAPGFSAGDVVMRIVVGGDLAADGNRQTAEELSYPLDPGARHGTSKVLRSGEPQLIPRVSDRILQEAANGPGHLGSLRSLDPKSYMVVPLRLAGAVAGALVMVSTDEGRIFGEEEMRRAKDLARCASLVLAGRSHAAGLPAGLRAGAGAGTSAVPFGTAELVDVPSAAAPRELPPGLQPKALEVLNLLNRGMSNTEAASALYCSESTTRDHLKKAYRALGVKNIQGALARARELDLLDD
jgi:DNA-binding CsgD family transcriptional regulator